MKFVCERCQTKYSIADDKVRGKVLKVRCKTCQNVITVREAGVRPSVEGLAPVRPTQRPTGQPSGPLATLGGDQELEDRSERTMLTSAPAALMAELAQPRRATPPPPPPVGDGIEWFLALEGAQQGPFSRKLLVDKLLLLPKDADVHVWNDRMDGWKPPADVPDVGRDLAARRAPAVPLRPPVPRATPSPPLPPMAARRGTMPLVSGLGPKMPIPGSAASLAHALPTPGSAAGHAHAVPGPLGGGEPLAAHHSSPHPAAPAHGLGHAPGAGAAVKTNGFAAHAVAPATALAGESDALSALNLGGAAARGARQSSASLPVFAPRIMEVGEATAWSGQGRVSEGRHRGTKTIVVLMMVVAAMIVIVAINLTKKAPVVTAAPPPKTGVDSESLAKLAESAAHEAAKEATNGGKPDPASEPSAPSAAAEPTSTSTSTKRGPHGRPVRGGRAVAGHAATTPGALAGTSPAAAPAEDPNASRFRDSERKVSPTSAVSNRPAPSQGDIARVIANNRIGIKTCYQRALLRDSSLTHGKIVVGVTIGLSGRVKHVTVDGPPSFRALDPCIKEMTARWVFPQSYEEYGTEFSYVFQGNE